MPSGGSPQLAGRESSASSGHRYLLGAFGDPGHAFPMIALGEALVARGHAVTLQTWERWRDPIEKTGMAFAAAPEYEVFPSRGRPLKPYEAAVRAARDTLPLVEVSDPDVVVADILTLAPALAGELTGRPVATLVPHIYPPSASGFPPYSLGARLPRTRGGRALWRALERPVQNGVRQGRDELNGARRRLGLAPVSHLHGGISRSLCLVATLPQLEYPRPWPAHARVVGPLVWEPPAEPVAIPPGTDPLVLIAPSTSQDRDHRLLRAALRGLRDLPVRILATTNGPAPGTPIDVPDNARLVDWLSYAQTMPQADVVVCHGGHGTLVRALASAAVPVVCPAAGDMNENAARLAWSGLGVRLPRRLASPLPIRLAVERVLADEAIRGRVAGVAAWTRDHDTGEAASAAIERLGARRAG